MSAANTGSIVGTIVSDIKVRTPNDSLSVAEFRVAPIDAREEDSPVPMVAYNGLGSAFSERYNKGDTIAVEYRLRYNTWQTPEGEPRGRMEVIATSYTTIRLGQISTAARAAKAAGVQEEPPLMPQAQAPAQAEPTLEEVPF
jgi:single-stranded DNA-binding protein